jgi:hypothetical protein
MATPHLHATKAVHQIARHAAGNSCLGGEPVLTPIAKKATDTLRKEGTALRLPQPSRAEVRTWIESQEFSASIEIPRGAERETTLASLSTLRRSLHETRVDGATFHSWKHAQDLTKYLSKRETAETKLVIAVDLDGCLYDFVGTMREWLVTRGWDREQMPDPTDYYLHHAWGITNDFLHAEITESMRAGVMFRSGTPMRDGTHGARVLGEQGHHLLINSARRLKGAGPLAKRSTMLWLREQGVHPDDIYLADPVKSEDKLKPNFDLLIDDHPGNIAAALEAGRSAVLLDRPWNTVYTDIPRATYADIIKDPFRFLNS